MDTAITIITLATVAALLGAVLYNADGVTRLLRALTSAIAGGLRAASGRAGA